MEVTKPGPFFSDHRVVNVVLDVRKENVISKTSGFRNWKEVNEIDFATDLNKLSISCSLNQKLKAF